MKAVALINRSRDTLMSYADRDAQSGMTSNTPKNFAKTHKFSFQTSLTLPFDVQY